jgi:hypothetical protein
MRRTRSTTSSKRARDDEGCGDKKRPPPPAPAPPPAVDAEERPIEESCDSCWGQPRTVRMRPCGHAASCELCTVMAVSSRQLRCTICRADVDALEYCGAMPPPLRRMPTYDQQPSGGESSTVVQFLRARAAGADAELAEAARAKLAEANPADMQRLWDSEETRAELLARGAAGQPQEARRMMLRWLAILSNAVTNLVSLWADERARAAMLAGASSPDWDLRGPASYALTRLTIAEDDEHREALWEHTGVRTAIVAATATANPLNVRGGALSALAHLAECERNKRPMWEYPGVLQAVLAGASFGQEAPVRITAMRVLAELAADDAIREPMLADDRVRRVLVAAGEESSAGMADIVRMAGMRVVSDLLRNAGNRLDVWELMELRELLLDSAESESEMVRSCIA